MLDDSELLLKEGGVGMRRKVKDLQFTTIANGHGPILRHNLEELVGRYRGWSESVGKAAASVAVCYSSDYGFSDRCAALPAWGGVQQLRPLPAGVLLCFALRKGEGKGAIADPATGALRCSARCVTNVVVRDGAPASKP